MCGIVGILARNYRGDHLRDDLDKAVGLLHHRGPDDRGTWLNGAGVALGHTRLSILDLSAHGHQPMVSADGRHVVVFNGEIYNFADIRARLEALGHSFAGSGDTEVILHAFREWGSAAVERFIGIFAIALWDEREQVLELVRDRIGVKPLYFGWDGSSLCFASELKALRAFRHWSPDVDREALGEFLQYGYVPDDRSIYKGVRKLYPGHRLRIRQGQQPVVEPYWSVLDILDTPLEGSDEDIEAELEALLIDAFRHRMVSDVPVGVYLSGGVDSSLVTALLARHYDQPIRTFTIGFAEKSHDESRWARRVAEHCDTVHSEYILEPREALEIARDWGSLFDEPFADSSSIPTLLVSRLASREVKVVLSADGGDELFSGYNTYKGVVERLERLSKLPGWLPNVARAGSALLAPAATWAPARKLHHWNEMFKNPTPSGLINVAMSHWYPDQIRKLLGHYEGTAGYDVYPGEPGIQISLRDFHHYLPGDILTKVDRTTMAASIEGRDPLLDHRLAEFAFRLPAHLRQGTLGPKHILRKILYRYVPRNLVDRPKMGFGIPKHLWLKGDLRELVDDFLAPDRIRRAGIMDSREVNRVVKRFRAGDASLAPRLWFLLTFEMWRERWNTA